MSGGAVRSRLVELRRALESARRGREVLERKRELLLRSLRQQRAEAARLRDALGARLTDAQAPLTRARIQLGGSGVDAAALAQPDSASVDWRRTFVLGVELPRLALRAEAFRPQYGPLGTCEALDRAGLAFTALLPDVVRLAEAELGVRALARGLFGCARRLSALEQAVIPTLERTLHEVSAALEEEERDESLRRKRWLDATTPRAPA